MAAYESIVVCGEAIKGKIATPEREVMSAARQLAEQMGRPLTVLLLGIGAEEAGRAAIEYGGDAVYTVACPAMTGSHPDLYPALMTVALSRMSAPSIILLSHTDLGREVAPRLGHRLKAGITMDCTKVDLDPATGGLLLSKPVYGGNAVSAWAAQAGRTQVVTMRPRSAAASDANPGRQGTITPLADSLDPSTLRGKVIEAVMEEAKGIKLEDAKVIVAGGGGIGGPEGFAMLEELARVLGGAVGVTRVPCDEGWKPLSMEIGQTGHIVSPNLYIAIGVSGAPQHMTGCSSAKLLVAVNRDPDANIFKEADLGVVAEYRKVLPSLIERCKALLG